MATSELIIDDDYISDMGNYLRRAGNSIDNMIDSYIAKLQEIKVSAIMEGEIANSLEAYITSAQGLKDRAGDMGTEMEKLLDSFIADVDKADQFLF